MKKMEYTEFGKTQLRVSRICLGTWGIGGAGWDSYSDESRMDAIKAAVDCGINFIDTAPAYNGGRTEQYIGEVVHKLGVRKEVILATKCGNEFINGKYVRCGSADKIMRECEESLRNLKTDYIDVYLVHWPDPNVPLSQIALNWTLQRPFISSCIIGAQSRDKIEENCKVFEWKLSDDEMQLLEQALKKTII